MIGQAPTDSGARWISGGTTAGGNPILTQITAQADLQLQSYITASYNSASPGQVPSQFTYPQTGSGSTNITGPFTNFDQSDVNYVRSTAADATAMISTNAGRFGAATAAAASLPTPYSPALATASYIATVAGFGADAIGQMVQPNIGQYSLSGVTSYVSGNLSDRYPGLAPAINETSNAINSSNIATKAQNSINNYWDSFVRYWSNSR
ncbi:hypothetical protein [Paraburkholderia sp. J10-1]|uniref:hypothetical protein n=1 Tax=Paraburkholderia sp. J10-1 TaxID=2805430 RepID=UPI002AB7C38A|nr:hypothetical protein [Paraburkholderia sp. J10-1]